MVSVCLSLCLPLSLFPATFLLSDAGLAHAEKVLTLGVGIGSERVEICVC